MATQTTPVWALPYPQEVDPADIPKDIKALADKLDAVLSAVRSGAAIPGELKIWPGGALPTQATYGHWVWADGVDYSSTTYPVAAGNIAAAWRTSYGKADPGAGRFRVPDMRGVAPVGLDAMPGGARANRVVRAAAITQAVLSGEEVHALLLAELAAHGHGVTDGGHAHPISDPWHWHPFPQADPAIAFASQGTQGPWVEGNGNDPSANAQRSAHAKATGITINSVGTGVSVQSAGGGGAHENMQPSCFVPYICKLDD